MSEVTQNPFAALGLSPITSAALGRCGYLEPTPIQAQCVPAIIAGHDVLGAAQTGSGKTGAFLWPMLERLATTSRVGKHPRALILAPTRELAAQIFLNILRYRGDSDVRPVLVIGGESSDLQRQELQHGCDIVVATPGRLIDAVLARFVSLEAIFFAVLDEADRMLELGFFNDTRKLLRACATDRQTLLFSATLHHEVDVLAEHVLTDPQRIEADTPGSMVSSISESQLRVRPSAKPALVAHLLKGATFERALVFVGSRAKALQLAIFLKEEGFEAAGLQGSLPQRERSKILDAFRNGKPKILVATDLASRGLDIDDIELVIHADIPLDAMDYVHRSGRSARMGRDGRSILLVSDEEVRLVAEIETLIGGTPKQLELEGFDLDAHFEALPLVELPKEAPRKRRAPAKGDRARRREKGQKYNRAEGDFKVKHAKKAKPAAGAKSKPKKQKLKIRKRR